MIKYSSFPDLLKKTCCAMTAMCTYRLIQYKVKPVQYVMVENAKLYMEDWNCINARIVMQKIYV